MWQRLPGGALALGTMDRISWRDRCYRGHLRRGVVTEGAAGCMETQEGPAEILEVKLSGLVWLAEQRPQDVPILIPEHMGGLCFPTGESQLHGIEVANQLI